MARLLLLLLLLLLLVLLPESGWSSWNYFTDNINETIIEGIAAGMVSSGLHDVCSIHHSPVRSPVR